MKTNIRYWQSVLKQAERELEAATGNITLKAAAKRYMRREHHCGGSPRTPAAGPASSSGPA